METVILAIITIFSIIVTIILWALEKSIASMIMLGVTIGFSLSTYISNACITNKPTAMDVYQDKTTLEYTIRDGEIIDSIVVYK